MVCVFGISWNFSCGPRYRRVSFLGDSVWPCCSAFLYAAECLPYTARKVWFMAKS